jgi:ubiquinone/menaquinone biosynthesis C-methylase UbiE
MSDSRKQEEIDFHDRHEKLRHELPQQEFDREFSNRRFYSIVTEGWERILEYLGGDCRGRRVLDYCCGGGSTGIELARRGAEVWSIDISPQRLATAAADASAAGCRDRMRFVQMDAEQLGFAESSFDVIICLGVLHHLELQAAYRELARVLRPSGMVVCIEALRNNPIIGLYRRLTPRLRTKWEMHHILSMKDVRLASSHFARIDRHFEHLLTLLAVPFRSTSFFQPLLRFLGKADQITLAIPGVRLMAWQVVFILSKPRSNAVVAD